MLQKISFGSLSAVLIVASTVWFVSSTANVSFAQVAEILREAKSYSLVMKVFVNQSDEKEKRHVATGRYFWRSPGSHRMELHEDSNPGHGAYAGDSSDRT